jgi:hypothetical protein
MEAWDNMADFFTGETPPALAILCGTYEMGGD